MKYRWIILFIISALFIRCGQEQSGEAKPEAGTTQKMPTVTGVAEFPDGTIKIDGENTDWDGKGVVVAEVGQPHDGGMGGFDIKTLQMGYDDQNLYFFLSMDKGIMERYEKKKSSGSIGDIYIDADGDTTTGSVNNDDIFGFPPLNGYDVKIWLPAGIRYDNQSKIDQPLVSYSVKPVAEDRSRFELSKKLAEANSIDQPDKIQYKGKNVEFAVPLKSIGIKPGSHMRVVISEYANSFNKGSANQFNVILH